MRAELLNRVKQDFYFTKYILNDNRKIAQYLKIDFANAKEINSALKLSIENAYIEAKKSILSELFFILDDAIYRMITPGKLTEAIKITNKLVFITIINLKILSPKNREHSKPTRREFTFNDLELKDIISQIPLISKKYIKAGRYVRLITALLKKYKETSQEKEEKLLVAPDKSKSSISETYDRDLEEIIVSIKKQFFNIASSIPELKKRYDDKFNRLPPGESEDLFKGFNFNSLEQFLLKQLSEFCRLRSSLLYIKSEGIDVLSTIMDLFKSQKNFLKLFEEEERTLFNTLSINNLEVHLFSTLENRLNNEMQKYIQDKFITPYTSL